MKQKNIIGILGGMGPQASVELYRLLIEGARVRYGARQNDEFPEILIDSVPVPDGFSHPENMEIVGDMLEDRSARMTAYGVTSIAMACNTVCMFAGRLRQKSHIDVVSTVDEVVSHVCQRYGNILLLSSSTSLKMRLYQAKLYFRGVQFVAPDVSQYDELDEIISGVLSGEDKAGLTLRLTRLVQKQLLHTHVDAIILGCTELPLIFPESYHLPVCNSLSILAESLLKRYYRKENI